MAASCGVHRLIIPCWACGERGWNVGCLGLPVEKCLGF